MQDLPNTFSGHIPKLVTRNSDSEIKIIWNDDKVCIYNLRKLRFNCQCALCKHEITREPLINLEDIPQDIKLLQVELVGNYALHFVWSDNHKTGIYSYELLRKLCD